MTQKRPATSSRSTTKIEPTKSYHAKVLRRVHEAQKAVKKAAVIVVPIVVFMLLYYYCSLESVAQYAVLYIFANDGKLSGRMSGDVKMRNGRSRAWVYPSLVQNDATSTQRNNFGVLSSAWNTLTDGQRKSWNVIGGYFTTDRFGRQVGLFGKQLFVALNRGLFNVGVAQVNTAPVTRGVVNAATLSVAVDDSATSMILTFTATPIPALTSWLVFATAPQSPGTFNPGNSQYRLITVLPAPTATGADVYTEYSDKFGAPPIGTKVFIKTVATSTVSGQQSAGHVAFAIVVA